MIIIKLKGQFSVATDQLSGCLHSIIGRKVLSFREFIIHAEITKFAKKSR